MAYDPNDYGSTPPPPPNYQNPPIPRRPPPEGMGVGQNIAQSCLIAGCVTVLVPCLLVFGFFLFLYFVAVSGMEQAGKAGGGLGSIYQTSGSANLAERQLREGSPENVIAIVSIQGVIDGNGSPLDGDGSMAFVSEQLRAVAANDSVRAVILQIDSPGGGLTASDQLYNEVKKLRERNIPVLAWAGSMMASGGYYIAVAADEIMATPTSTVGSIGVIMQHFQVRELLEKIGVRVDPITSGERKDLASPFREMTPEERKLLQDYIDTAHRRFVDVVAEGRKMPAEDVRKLADGGIFSAAVARDNGLVDSIGYIDDAISWAEDKAKKKNMRVIGYRRIISFGDLFREAGRGAAGAVVESAVANEQAAPRAMAVWNTEN